MLFQTPLQVAFMVVTASAPTMPSRQRRLTPWQQLTFAKARPRNAWTAPVKRVFVENRTPILPPPPTDGQNTPFHTPLCISDLLCDHGQHTWRLHEQLTASDMADKFNLYGVDPDCDIDSATSNSTRVVFKNMEVADWLVRCKGLREASHWLLFQHCVERVNALETSVVGLLLNEMAATCPSVWVTFVLQPADARSFARVTDFGRALEAQRPSDSAHVWVPHMGPPVEGVGQWRVSLDGELWVTLRATRTTRSSSTNLVG